MIFQPSILTKEYLLKQRYKKSEVETTLKAQEYFLKLNHNLESVFSEEKYSYKRIFLVANVFASKRYNYEIICATFLSHCLHCPASSRDYIIKEFGSDLYSLAASVFSIDKTESKFFDYIEIAEVIKSLLNDQRIWLIKLICRYFDLTYIDKIKDASIQKNLVKQTRDVYLTIADVLQERTIKEELEDMIFEFLEPSVRGMIVERLGYFKSNNANIVASYSKQIKHLLLKKLIFANVTGRIKRPYSIWKKMQLKDHSFEGINDLLAFRVVVNSEKVCYKTLGVLHSHFSSVNNMFKDYISHPKINGYQSIHTGLLTKDDEIFELQIRTKKMDLEANYGNSSHWIYKSGKQELSKSYVRQVNNLMSRNMAGKGYFSYENKISEGDKVNVFTPTKSPVILPQGSTVIDFAYSIHTDLGNSFDYSKVNNKAVNSSYKLQEGDIVEVFTTESKNPQAIWLNSCITSGARSEIKKYLRGKRDLGNKNKVHEIMQYLASQAYSTDSEYSISALLEKTAYSFNTHNYNSLYNNILSYDISHLAILSNIFKVEYNQDKINSSYLHYKSINNTKKDKVKFYTAKCCYALPGDEIIAVEADKQGRYLVHSVDCKVYQQHKDNLYSHKISWAKSRKILSKSFIALTVLEENANNIYKIFQLIDSLNSSILSCEIKHIAPKKLYTIKLVVTIQSRSRFKELCTNIYRRCAINSLETPNDK